MFFISSHCESGSECEPYQIDNIFSMHSAEASELLESYNATQKESNHLLSIPKIIFLDMCRGSGKATVRQIETAEENNEITTKSTKTTMDDENEKKEIKLVTIHKMKEECNENNSLNEKRMGMKLQKNVTQESASQSAKVINTKQQREGKKRKNRESTNRTSNNC